MNIPGHSRGNLQQEGPRQVLPALARAPCSMTKSGRISTVPFARRPPAPPALRNAIDWSSFRLSAPALHQTLKNHMGFMRAQNLFYHQAFLPVLAHPTSAGPGPPRKSTCCRKTKIVANLDAPIKQTTRKWPWVFKQPGRCVELPAEDVFEGFDGLLLDEELPLDGKDDQDDQASSPSSSYSKVSREVRKAYAFVSLDAAPAPEVVMLSENAARLTGIPFEAMNATSWREEEVGDKLNQIALGLTGTSLDVFVGAQPFSSNYGGHQFGNWAGQLGDGRVCTLGEIQVEEGMPGSVLEVQLKGIGQTPFSRNGDGKAALGACLREFLFSEAFVGLGLPAARAVSVCSTGEGAKIRDSDPRNSGVLKRARGAVLCRVAPSFLRFGTFELPARRGDVELVGKLADYCLRHLVPHLESSPSIGPIQTEDSRRRQYGDPIFPGKDPSMEGNEKEDEHINRGMGHGAGDHLGMLVAMVQVTARMIAGWQAMGFCHGVLNTDNFTLLGLALDFGPCSFMEEYDPAWSPNEGDSALRYAFQNQPDIAAWNCERLGEAFSSIVGLSGVARANEAFSPAFDAAYTSILQRKLGLSGMELGSGWMHPSRSGGGAAGATKDAQFVLEYFRLMSTCRVDFTDTWRALLDVPALSMTRKARRFSGGAVEGGEGRSDIGQGSGRDCASGTQEDDTWGNLRPLRSVLMAAGASGKQIREWAAWVHEYSSRIDTQGIGKFHPEGEAEGRRERLEIMRKSNPAFVLRAATLEQALKSAEIGDMSRVHQLEERLSRAYEQEAARQSMEPRAI